MLVGAIILKFLNNEIDNTKLKELVKNGVITDEDYKEILRAVNKMEMLSD